MGDDMKKANERPIAELMGNLEVGDDEAPTTCQACKGRGWIALGPDSDTECHSCGGTGMSWIPDVADESEQRLRAMGG
jgi:DnaJ-class molecular chaperone